MENNCRSWEKNFFTSVSAYKTSPQQIEFFHEYTVVHTVLSNPKTVDLSIQGEVYDLKHY